MWTVCYRKHIMKVSEQHQLFVSILYYVIMFLFQLLPNVRLLLVLHVVFTRSTIALDQIADFYHQGFGQIKNIFIVENTSNVPSKNYCALLCAMHFQKKQNNCTGFNYNQVASVHFCTIYMYISLLMATGKYCDLHIKMFYFDLPAIN